MKKKKTYTRPGNRQLKNEYDKGFAAGVKAGEDKVLEFRKRLAKNLSQQLIDYVHAGIGGTVTMDAKELVDIVMGE